jgi:hypothetical protein
MSVGVSAGRMDQQSTIPKKLIRPYPGKYADNMTRRPGKDRFSIPE